MEFREKDAVVVRETGKRGTIIRVMADPPPPYQVELLEGGDVSWLHAADLMLWCGCDISFNGCSCGASKREREG
jgi:hypothetical protein